MTTTTYCPDWLQGYASDDYGWKCEEQHGRSVYSRRMGVVEGLFDNDGEHFEGRADLNCALELEFRSSLDKHRMREHISLAWSVLRQQHILLSTGTAYEGHRRFVYEQPSTAVEVIERGNKHITYVADTYPDIDVANFYHHLMNVSRAFDSKDALSRLLVLPFQHTPSGTFNIKFIFVVAHQITDGLTIFRWVANFIDLLNLSPADLRHKAKSLSQDDATPRLPLPQESLYHPIRGSKVRQRWYWAIARVLRHVKKQPPASFPNPLRKVTPTRNSGLRLPETYSKVLDYSSPPPTANLAIQHALPPHLTHRLLDLCRDANVSVGAGLFTLVALAMMGLHTSLHPETDPNNLPPFVGSFPINPRPFLTTSTTGREDSLMLAFSEGITLPTLPSTLSLTSRFRLLSRLASKQLRQYQKRPTTAEEELALGTKSPRFLLPSLYLSTMDRLDAGRPPAQRSNFNIQGSYPAAPPNSMATCGVSSVGDRSAMLSRGRYDTSVLPEGKTVVADFVDVNSAVRAREGEFLCGVAGDKVAGKVHFMVSADAGGLVEDAKGQFVMALEGVLEAVAREAEHPTAASPKEKARARL